MPNEMSRVPRLLPYHRAKVEVSNYQYNIKVLVRNSEVETPFGRIILKLLLKK
jgi:hypothetical protein